MVQVNEDPHEAVTRWLEEAGRRSAPAARKAIEPEPRAPRRWSVSLRHGRQLVLFGVLALAFLQYYALDVMLQIEKLPSIVVFVPIPDAPRG